MKQKLLQIGAQLIKLESTADKTWKVKLACQELENEQTAFLNKHLMEFGYFVFKPTKLEQADLVDIPDVVPGFRGEKSPSQRLRAVIYRIWEQRNKPTKTFEEYYRQMMEKIIEWSKSKLENEK